MAFHITVICADPAVEAALADALAPTAIAESEIARYRPDLPGMISDVSWLTSPANVSPRSDLAIVYEFPYTAVLVQQLLPIFSHTRILLMTGRGDRNMRYGGKSQYIGPFINYIIVPFDPEELHLRIYNMLKTPRAGKG
jgi:hypothetical protein